jgi:RNase P/RNase MRP subunit p29
MAHRLVGIQGWISQFQTSFLVLLDANEAWMPKTRATVERATGDAPARGEHQGRQWVEPELWRRPGEVKDFGGDG